VQLDVQTGQKQAKLYNPNEENPALAGLPVNQEVIVVDQELPHDSPRIPAGAPAYEPVGVVKAPREKNEGFSQALQTVKTSSEHQKSIERSVLDEALQLLEDLSHDMYYGLQVAEDTKAVQSLFCLLFREDDAGGEARPLTERADFLASSILSAALGNNAPSLAAIEKSWDTFTGNHCKSHSHSIKQELFHRLAPVSEPNTKQESEEVDSIRLHLTVISGLLKSSKIRTEFLDNNGLKSFLQILLRDGEEWEPRRAKVAQIVSDTFLDEDLGATLDLWPRQQQPDTGKCLEGGPQSLADECWEHWVAAISQMPEAPEWSQELISLIKRTQTLGSQPEVPPKHKEL
jgi:nucleotide exchange factor SIL1